MKKKSKKRDATDKKIEKAMNVGSRTMKKKSIKRDATDKEIKKFLKDNAERWNLMNSSDQKDAAYWQEKLDKAVSGVGVALYILSTVRIAAGTTLMKEQKKGHELFTVHALLKRNCMLRVSYWV